MRYQLLGVRSGTSAHILSTLLESWRRMLRSAALLGGLTVIMTEIVAFSLVHQFPPSLPTNAVALGLGLAVAYGAAATIFIQELFRGAIRAITMLQGEAEAAMGAAVIAFPTSMPPATATPQPMHEPMPSLLPLEEQRPAVHSLPVAAAPVAAAAVDARSLPSLPHLPALRADVAEQQAHHVVEDEPTRPVSAVPDAPDYGATIMVPDNSMYAPRLVPRTQPSRARPSAPMAPFARPAGEDNGAHPLPAAAVARPSAHRLPPLAEASPSPGLYAPWSAVPPIADPTAKTEMSTMAAHEAALVFRPVRRPGWWPRRRVRPLPTAS